MDILEDENMEDSQIFHDILEVFRMIPRRRNSRKKSHRHRVDPPRPCLITSLPQELLDNIIGSLDFSDLKSFRSLCKTLALAVEPTLFSKISFSLDVDSYDNLLAISKHDRLRHYVKRLHLERKNCLVRFCNIDQWTYSSIHSNPYPYGYTGDRTKPPVAPGGISEEEWNEVVRNRLHLTLFEAYNEDIQAYDDYMKTLADATRDACIGGLITDPKHSGSTHGQEAALMLQKLEEAIKDLSQLTDFTHMPIPMRNPPWSLQWRDLRFNHRHIRPNIAAAGAVLEADTLQYFIVLRALARCGQQLSGAMRCATAGVAFWNSSRIGQLLSWQRNVNGEKMYTEVDRPRRDIYQHILSDNSNLTRRAGEEFAQLLYTIRGVFAPLRILEWTAIAKADPEPAYIYFGRLLFASEHLEEVTIAIRRRAYYRMSQTYWRTDKSMDTLLATNNTSPKLVISAQSLFVPWSRSPSLRVLKSIHLSVLATEDGLWGVLGSAPRLRNLTLDHVALVPDEGVWDSLLGKIRTLKLDTLHLNVLEDKKGGHARAVLDQERWSGWAPYHFLSYKEAIMDWVTRVTQVLPDLTMPDYVANNI